MVNGAWSGQLEVEFLLQVFTIRQASAWALSLTGVVFGLLIVRKNAARSDPPQAGRSAGCALWWIKSTAYKAPGAPIEGYPLGTTPRILAPCAR